MTDGLVNLDGRLLPLEEARLSVLDHGLLYGDGLFETLRVYDGRFYRAEAHLVRLRDAASRLDLPLPWSDADLLTALRETAAANALGNGVLRLTVTRGAGPPLPDPSLCREPCFFVTARPGAAPGAGAFERGVTACFAGRHPAWIVPGVKALSYLPFQHARQEARRRGFDEALLTHGEHVVEAATSNLFIVRDEALLTPGLESGCLPGITRAVVLELAAEAGLEAREAPLTRAGLCQADEVFLTNSVQEIVPVLRLEDHTPGTGAPGPITRRLYEAYRAQVCQWTSDPDR